MEDSRREEERCERDSRVESDQSKDRQRFDDGEEEDRRHHHRYCLSGYEYFDTEKVQLHLPRRLRRAFTLEDCQEML